MTPLLRIIMTYTALIAYTLYLPIGMGQENDPKACDAALTACLDVVSAQNDQILHLKQQNERLRTNLASSEAKQPTFPGWFWALVGGLVGATTVELIK